MTFTESESKTLKLHPYICDKDDEGERLVSTTSFIETRTWYGIMFLVSLLGDQRYWMLEGAEGLVAREGYHSSRSKKKAVDHIVTLLVDLLKKHVITNVLINKSLWTDRERFWMKTWKRIKTMNDVKIRSCWLIILKYHSADDTCVD